MVAVPLSRAGIDPCGRADNEFTMGMVPPVAKFCHDPIMNGFFAR